MDEQFYVTLPSNTEKDSTASNFRVNLPKKIRLQSDNWVVGLAEIIYPFSWHNIIAGDNTILLHLELNSKEMNIITIKIPPSFYHTVEELLVALENALHPLRSAYKVGKNAFSVTHVERGDQIAIHIDPKIVKKVQLCPKLSEVFGFNRQQVYTFRLGDSKPFVRYGSRSPELRNDLQTIYVYCDIVAQQIVGNTLAPLLRIIDVQGRYRDIINRTFTTPHYVPVLNKDISSIEIDLKTDLDQSIDFQFGKTVAILHFKKRQYYLE